MLLRLEVDEESLVADQHLFDQVKSSVDLMEGARVVVLGVVRVVADL